MVVPAGSGASGSRAPGSGHFWIATTLTSCSSLSSGRVQSTSSPARSRTIVIRPGRAGRAARGRSRPGQGDAGGQQRDDEPRTNSETETKAAAPAAGAGRGVRPASAARHAGRASPWRRARRCDPPCTVERRRQRQRKRSKRSASMERTRSARPGSIGGRGTGGEPERHLSTRSSGSAPSSTNERSPGSPVATRCTAGRGLAEAGTARLRTTSTEPLTLAVGCLGLHRARRSRDQAGTGAGPGVLGAGDRQLGESAGGGDVRGEAFVAAGVEVEAVHLEASDGEADDPCSRRSDIRRVRACGCRGRSPRSPSDTRADPVGEHLDLEAHRRRNGRIGRMPSEAPPDKGSASTVPEPSGLATTVKSKPPPRLQGVDQHRRRQPPTGVDVGRELQAERVPVRFTESAGGRRRRREQALVEPPTSP